MGIRNYKHALPYTDRIDKINKLFESGNEITYYTARGTTTGLDWYSLTDKQLKKWGCKYHNLSVGEKPAYDLLICDKAINTEEYFKKSKEFWDKKQQYSTLAGE